MLSMGLLSFWIRVTQRATGTAHRGARFNRRSPQRPSANDLSGLSAARWPPKVGTAVRAPQRHVCQSILGGAWPRPCSLWRRIAPVGAQGSQSFCRPHKVIGCLLVGLLDGSCHSASLDRLGGRSARWPATIGEEIVNMRNKL